MVTTKIRERLETKEDLLSPFAKRSRDSNDREKPEDSSPMRTEFQRDRDRLIHSKSFRRLKHKTQVFIAPLGDHYITRLTHTLEVAQIARTIARALNLNEDLAEAVSLGHDLGHTPFGHVGEDELDRVSPSGFRHAQQSLHIVEHLEREGMGLNLTKEVRLGIVNHSKPRGDFLEPLLIDGLSLEAQICRLSDAIAYLNHDLLDAFRAGVIDMKDIPSGLTQILGESHSDRVDTMVSDVVSASWGATGDQARSIFPQITMSRKIRDAVYSLREFMFKSVYVPEDRGETGQTARRIIRMLYRYFDDNRDRIPPELRYGDRAVVDHLSGMTDNYAMRVAESIEPGISRSLTDGVS
ncbi:MAG: deoxyguanosinetriphosphate triphosphohydrolase [SAR202 cluster bacterium]|nr:deoxyguanosinetriphosphate triphosphohydrolase [SAR202 cluster bacterium]